MSERSQIPIFPLNLLPIPGELIPLHIFEPRYRQLLLELETKDVGFGIYFNHDMNRERLGSLMKLESVIKRYPGGESDIIVRCKDTFTMDKFYGTFHDKLYPGGDVYLSQIDAEAAAGLELYHLFLEYQTQRKINCHATNFSLYQIAHEMDFDLGQRYQFLSMPGDKRSSFLVRHIKFQLHVWRQAEKSKHVFHLN